MQEGRKRKALKSQKEHSHTSVISPPARPPTYGRYLKESAFRWKTAGQASEFKKRLQDSTSDRARHCQLRHRPSAPHLPRTAAGPEPCAAAPSLCSHRCQELRSSFRTPLPAPKPAQCTEHPRTGTPDGCRGALMRRHQLAAAFSGGRDQPGASTARLSRGQLSGRRLFENLLPSLFGWGRASKGCREGHPRGHRCTGRAEPFS